MPHQDLYDYILKQTAGSGDSRDKLTALVNEHPYFSAAHFFLLRETPKTHPNYPLVAARTAIHFNNPFFLQFQLNREEEEERVADKAELIVPTEPVTETIKLADDPAETGAEFIKESHPEELTEPSTGSLEEKILPLNTPVPAAKEELLFEPLYTTDYFASQGIKLRDDAQPTDKLGKQLKSFTDWLKTMKKVHDGKLPDTAGTDMLVQNLAEKSNKEQEVITEAMAEVFVQQGKKGKAVEIYKKLSLLNPAKSAYFAAKIELLKES